MLLKNVAGQKLVVFAFDVVADAPKTGDAANITASVSKDGAGGVASNDANPAEIGGGLYAFDLSQAETNCDLLALYAASTTANVKIDPVVGYTHSPTPDDRLVSHPDAYVLVAPSTTDAGRGTNLLAAYAAAKALTPNGGALSHTNRAAVLIPPGHYLLASTLTLNANFVDLIATEPEMPNGRREDDDDSYYYDADGYHADPNSCRPQSTMIYATAAIAPITQSVADVQLSGFSMVCLGTTGSLAGFYVSTTDNSPSVYDRLYIWLANTSDINYGATLFAQHIGGTWSNCVANERAWRCGVNGEFKATMTDCQAGFNSFGGDAAGASFTKCRLTRCSLRGIVSLELFTAIPNTQGACGFGGCESFGIPATSDSWFIDCAAGDNSYNIGKAAGGNYIRCRGGAHSFGSTTNPPFGEGTFTGYAEDCVAGAGGFGGARVGTAITVASYCAGHLVRCVSIGSAIDRQLKGATIEGGLFTNVTNNKDCFKLLDSLSKVHNATILVVEGGTGIPINDDGTARTVSAAGNRYNNLGATGTGLGALTTNRANTGEDRTRKALPAVAPAASGGLPTVDASNRVAGVSGNVAGSVGSILGGGSGARTVTITVNNGATALQSANVRVTKGAESYVLSTNVSGVAVFNLDDGSWTVAITLAGYTYSGTTLVVDGTETATYSMTQVVVPASDPGLITGYLYCYDELGAVEKDVIVELRFFSLKGTGISNDTATRTATSSVAGLATFTNLFLGATYVMRRGKSSRWTEVTIPAAATSPYAMPDVWGRDT